MHNQSDQTRPTLGECEAFCNWKSPYTIERFVRRDELQLSDWFVPRSHGAAIIAPSLVCKFGFSPSCFEPRGWLTRTKLDGYHKWLRDRRRLVRKCGDLFSVECSLSRTMVHSRVLVWHLGAMPVFTHTPQEAMFLSQLDELPSHFRWVELCPWTDLNVQFERVTSLSLHPRQSNAQRRAGISLSRRLLNGPSASAASSNRSPANIGLHKAGA
jgi:hypothetical protein